MRFPPVISTSSLAHLECARCERREYPDRLTGVCAICGGPILACYNLAREDLRGLPWDLPNRAPDIWRYAELLPVRASRFRIGLGEGMTPLLQTPRLGREVGALRLHIKDEGRNPTGSFKSRGMAVAVARAVELGASCVAAPSAGNAGLALAAYAARHGIRSVVAFPEDIPPAYVRESRAYGAEVIVAGATISEAAAELRKRLESSSGRDAPFDLSTLREPYRLEGKKTMGYEIAEQLPGHVPDAVVYPTGGGTGLIGIAKAFREMAEMGWIEPNRHPRMIAVQMAGCAPIVDAFLAGRNRSVPQDRAATRCWGLRVPSPFADREILETLRLTGGSAIAVAEEELHPAFKMAARLEGLDMAPEGCAALAAVPHLLRTGAVRTDETIVLLNTAESAMYR